MSSDLSTDIVFTDQLKGGITAKKLNLSWRDATIQPAFISGKPAVGGYNSGDYLLLLKADGTYAKIPPAAVGSGGTGGSGDMLKSVYDTNLNGVVDTADAIAWGSVTGKPASFVPNAHAPSHLDNGSDPLPVATTSRTGSLRVLNGTATMYLDGTGNWSTPAPGGTVNPGTWTNLTYSSGWTQNTSAQFRIETNGTFQKVICQGIINYLSGAASLAFTLPVGARPGVARGCALAGYDSSGDVQLFQAVVAASGAVNIYPMVRQNFSWPSATNGSVYLDNLVFSL